MTLTRILGLALLSAAAALPAYAQEMEVRTTKLTGPYVGLYGGYGWTDADGAASDPDGWDYGVFAGYKLDAIFGDYRGFGANGAIEAFYGFSSADGGSGVTAMDKDDEWGVSFRPGLSFLDRMSGDFGLNSYAILGYRNTEFEAAGNSDRYDGFELGIGAQIIAVGDAGLRVEYSHVWYGSEGGIDPDSDAIRVGMSYHF